jgi:hypothetical protein
VGFEPTIPVFEREKTVHGLDLVVTVISKVIPVLNYQTMKAYGGVEVK